MSSQAFGDADALFMARALALAERGMYTATPNPRVGCVIVDDGRVIGEGWHEKVGGPHAEVVAMRDAEARQRDVRGATLYVTLEPCNHSGRTPPCTEASCRRVGRVVAAMADPNRARRGGAGRLRAAGIRVDIGLLEREARALNPGFVSRVTRGRPYVRMKIATTLDGRTATVGGSSTWITGQRSTRRWSRVARPGVRDPHRHRDRAGGQSATQRTRGARRRVSRCASSSTAMRRRRAKRACSRGGALMVTAGAAQHRLARRGRAIALPDAQGRVDLRR